MLEVGLMADARARWYHAEIVERLLRPLQELIALLVLPILFLDVFLNALLSPAVTAANDQ
jgi:hypothetical protein